MRKENTLLILWVIFGFVFIRAFDSVLFLFTHIVYFGTSKIGIPYYVLKYFIPIFTFLSYISATSLTLRRLKMNSKSNGIYLTEFPKQIVTPLILIAIFLQPITNKLAGLFAEYNSTAQSENATDFIDFYGWMYFGIGFSRWTVLIVLVYIYLNRHYVERIK